MDKGRFGNIEIKRICPVGDCLFYTIGKSLTDEDINDINTITEFENILDEKGIDCIKINNIGQIFYRPAISEEEKKLKIREQEIDKDSDDFKTVCSKLFEYSKKFVVPDSSNSFGLPTILIKEYAKRQTGEPVNYMKARIDEDSSIGPYLSICVEKIEYNNSTTTVETNVKDAGIVGTLSNVLNPKHKPFETYMLGTQTHVSSFVMQNGGTYYLFDTTGHTHQKQQNLNTQTQFQQQPQIQQNEVQYYTSELIFKKETPLPNKPNVQSENQTTDESGKTIYPIILNPFGLDYQNGSSACGIWTVNVLAAVSKTYTNVEDFIIKDEEEDYVAMFKSEFILKVSAEVAKKLSTNPEVKILEQEEDLLGYCKCKVGNTLFAINTAHNTGSCLNMKNVLLSVSQKELEFYNDDDNNINNEIIERRKQLIERIKIEKTKHEIVINIMKEIHAVMSKKTKQHEIAGKLAKLFASKSSDIKAPEPFKKTGSGLDELKKIESNITGLKQIESKMAELRMAELKKIKSDIIAREKIELEKIKSNIVELEGVEPNTTELEKAIQSKIAKLKQIESETVKQKIEELEKAKQKIDKLKSAEMEIIKPKIIELEKINLNIDELEKIKSITTKLKEITEQNVVGLGKSQQEITQLEADKKKKQLEYCTEFVRCFFARIFIDIKNNDNIVSSMIEKIKSYCEKQIKIANNQIAHAEKVDELFIRYKERQNEQINQFQQNNTKPQKSDYSIGPR